MKLSFGCLLLVLSSPCAIGARHSDGSAGTVLMAAGGWSPLAGLNQFTVTLWLRPDSLTVASTQFLRSSSSTAPSEWDLNQGFGQLGGIGLGSTASEFCCKTFAPPDTNWRFLAYRKLPDGTFDAFYGGVKTTIHGPIPTAVPGALDGHDQFDLFAALTACCAWPGAIADVHVSRRGMTDGELQTMAGARHPVMDSATAAYWPLDGYSATEPDLSGGGHPLTAIGTGFTHVAGPTWATGGPMGPTGPAGPQGNQGPPGVINVSSSISVYVPLRRKFVDPDAGGNYTLDAPGTVAAVMSIQLAAGPEAADDQWSLLDNVVQSHGLTGRVFFTWTGR
jgi:hypothetical protein